MSIQAFPAIPSNELDSKAYDAATKDKDAQKILKTGEVPDNISFDIKDSTLTEYSGESNYEPYSGIVLDPEDNVFKTVSGMFRDKKEFYEKLTKRGYVVRKVFEKKVFDWIEENAKTTMEAYLMFSTAFSKWKGNNLLDQYYTKLLNDIPQLNREKVKGNPNSRGKEGEEESVLEEDNALADLKQRINTLQNDKFEQYKLSHPKLYELYQLVLDKLPNYLDKNAIKQDVEYNQTLTCKDVVDSYKKSDPAFIRKYLKPAYQTPKNDTPLGMASNGAEYNVTVDSYDKDRNKLPKSVTLRNQPIFFLGNLMPSRDKKGSISKFFSQNPNFVANLFKEVNGPIRNPETNEIMYDELGHTLNGAPETSGFDNNAKYLVINIDGKGSFEVDIQQVRDLYNNLLKGSTKTDAQLANASMDNLFNSELKARDTQALNSMWDYNATKDLEPLTADSSLVKSRDFMSNQNPLKILKQAKLKEIMKVLKYNDVEVDGYDPRAYLDKINKDLIDYQNLEADLRSLSAKTTTPVMRQEIIDKYNATDKMDCDQKIKLKQKQILMDYEPQIPVKDFYKGIDATQGREQEVAKSQKSTPSMSADIKQDLSKELARQGVKSGGYRSKITNESRDDSPIPIIDDIIPCQRVNHNATLGYANQPIDGVITNPGAIQTSGRYMSEQDEHWGWVHDELNQELFDGTRLRPEVREALLRIADKFKRSLGLSIEPVDIYFTGSSANFNYNDLSDLDLHLVYDFEEIGINAEILIKYFVAKKQVFNNDYEISIKGIPVEVGVENLNEPIVSSAIYSVVKDAWMLEPEYAEQLLPQPDMKQYYAIVQKIEKAIETRNSAEIGKVWDELYDIRKQSLAQEGEYGKGNALFKKLRNLGYLDRLKNAYYSSASEELSLESLKEIL